MGNWTRDLKTGGGKRSDRGSKAVALKSTGGPQTILCMVDLNSDRLAQLHPGIKDRLCRLLDSRRGDTQIEIARTIG